MFSWVMVRQDDGPRRTPIVSRSRAMGSLMAVMAQTLALGTGRSAGEP